jgi:hypothetical protein
MSNVYVVVEGPQDVEFLARILEADKFEKKVKMADLRDEFCKRLITTLFPHQDDLHKRVPNPMFLSNGSKWVAIQSAGGHTGIVKLVRAALFNLQDLPGCLAAIGIVRDADDSAPPQQLARISAELQTIGDIPNVTLEVPGIAGAIADGTPRLGVYVLPDNDDRGTLDTLLLECGQAVYPGLISGAQLYVNGVYIGKLDGQDSRMIEKPFGKPKAIVACAANILKPGMSIATSIDQNRWLSEESRKLPRVAAIAKFLKNLCGLN